jgi:hypothetical protein
MDNFEIPYMKYAAQVLNFANKTIKFYSSSIQRKFDNKWDKEQYELFWKEFNEYHQILVNKCSK